jgi:hypothetical protein
MSEEDKEHSSDTSIGRETSKVAANSDSKSTEKTSIDIWTISRNIIHAIEVNIQTLEALEPIIGEGDEEDFSDLVIHLRKGVTAAAAVVAKAAKKMQDSDADSTSTCRATSTRAATAAIRGKPAVSDAPKRKNTSKRKRESSKGDEDVVLKMVGQKKYRKTCSADGCTNQAVNGGVCVKHGAKRKLCSIDGCTKQAKKGGVCRRHGATWVKKLCSIDGCTNQAQKGGVCIKHGAKIKRCRIDGCTNQAQNGGVCIKHGAKGYRKQCRIEGCTNQAKKRGVCKRHGAYRNPNDESTAFPSCYGSEFDKTTATYPYQYASADSARRAQVQGSIPDEVVVCEVIGNYEEV